jgi:hypothetical protein
MHRILNALLVPLLGALLLGGCSVIDRSPDRALDARARWVLLPMLNHTETPQAGLRAEAIMEGLLRARGVTDLARYPSSVGQETLFDPAERKVLEQALDWARKSGARYALTGAVDEWRYKVGIDGEPAVGMTLQVIDLADGGVAYSAAGGRAGWSREALSAVAQKLARQLLEGLRLAR